MEKYFDLYDKFRSESGTFADFVKWYKTIRFHESLALTANSREIPFGQGFRGMQIEHLS